MVRKSRSSPSKGPKSRASGSQKSKSLCADALLKQLPTGRTAAAVKNRTLRAERDEEGKMECVICRARVSARAFELRRHYKTHLDVKPYVCYRTRSCVFAAVQKQNFDSHVESKHDGLRLVCAAILKEATDSEPRMICGTLVSSQSALCRHRQAKHAWPKTEDELQWYVPLHHEDDGVEVVELHGAEAEKYSVSPNNKADFAAQMLWDPATAKYCHRPRNVVTMRVYVSVPPEDPPTPTPSPPGSPPPSTPSLSPSLPPSAIQPMHRTTSSPPPSPCRMASPSLPLTPPPHGTSSSQSFPPTRCTPLPSCELGSGGILCDYAATGAAYPPTSYGFHGASKRCSVGIGSTFQVPGPNEDCRDHIYAPVAYYRTPPRSSIASSPQPSMSPSLPPTPTLSPAEWGSPAYSLYASTIRQDWDRCRGYVESLRTTYV